MLAVPHQQRASSVHRPVGASGRVQGRRCARAKARQTRSAPRHGRISGRSCSADFCGAAVDPVRRTICAARAQPHAAAPPDAGGTARSIRGSRPPAADLALLRGCAVGGCHLPRATRSDGRGVRQLPVLALFTFRPEFEPPWVGLPNVGTLTLGRLDRSNVESMVGRVTGGRLLPAEVMKQIVTKTDGNPLFVEELTKTVLEAGILVEDAEGYRLDGPLPPLAIPETLQDSLMARLDRLAPVREIAQIGAAIGREFSYPLVRALVGRDESALKHALAQLEQAELVFRRGEPPEAIYSFKHALVRDAAYESLLKSRRQQLHGQIARALEQSFADIVASQPEIVAHHFTAADLVDPAIDYWLRAGNLALSRSANAEAVKHLRQGIKLTRSLASSPERVRKELDFYLALGPATAATEGDAAPETLRVFSHARELLGDGGTLTE